MKRVLLSMISVLFLSMTYAQVPGTLSYQGILVDNAGAPVADGSHFVKFYFYNDPALEADPANLKYKSEGTGSGNQVTTYKGMFTFIIGSGSIGNDPIPTTIFSTQLYVKVIADGTTLTPKIALTTVPYAMNAQNAATAQNAVTAQNANAMDAAGLTGTLAPARIAASSIDNTLLASGIDATKITTGLLGSNTVNSAAIADGSIVAADLNGMGATANQVLQSDGIKWAPANLPATFNTKNYIPRGDGAGMVASNIFSDGVYTGINRTTPIGASVIDVEGTAGAGVYTGMYMSGTDAASWPFYGYATGGTGKVWTYYDGSTNLWKLNANGDRLTVDGNNGNVGIGTTAPAEKLEVLGNIKASSNISAAGALTAGSISAAGALTAGSISATGALTAGSISTSSLTVTGSFLYMTGSNFIFNNASYFDFNNTIIPNNNSLHDLGTTSFRWRTLYTNNVVNVSDVRLKKNISPLNYGLTEVLKLRPVSYILNDDETNETRLGLIAQEVRKLIPEVILEEKTGEKYLAMNYTELIPILIKAIQQQQTQIEELKSTNSSIKNELTQFQSLSAQVEELKKLINDKSNGGSSNSHAATAGGNNK